MREEELLKLVIVVYEAASAFTRRSVTELRDSVTSSDDNVTRKHSVTRYRMSHVRGDIRLDLCSRLICTFKCARILQLSQVVSNCLERVAYKKKFLITLYVSGKKS